MPARFRISDSFPIRDRQLVVLAGDITDGTIKAGMLLAIPVNGAITLAFPVHGVEFMDSLQQAETKVALTIRCDSEGMADMLLGLNIKGEELEVRERQTGGREE